jgi:hypothetical protein
MKCDQCDREDIPAKRRHMVGPHKGRDDSGVPITHYECESGHRFHFPAASGPESQQMPCDGPSN